MAAWSGIPTVVTGAETPDVLHSAVAGVEVGTWVEPHSERLPARKLWIAFCQPSAGRLSIDAGAVTALVEKGRSLLPVGVVRVEGRFQAGEAVEVFGPDARLIAKGLVRLDAAQMEAARGRRSDGAEAIHRDDLVVLTTGSSGAG
jgi:glutamate 5-kinase